MKKTLKMGKKALSVFMAALMVMTAWVFFAPEKAEAATAGKYDVKVQYNPEDGAYSYDEVMRIRYRTDNGKGSKTDTLSQDFKNDGNKGTLDKEFTHTFKDVPGFPYEAEIYCSGLTMPAGKVKYGVKVWVSKAGANSFTLVRDSDWKEKSHGYNWGRSFTDTFPISSGYPYVNSVSWNEKNATVTVPKDSSTAKVSTSSATVRDQYGVEWYQEPYYSLHTSSAAGTTSDRITGVTLSTYNMADTTTLQVTNAAKDWVLGNNNSINRDVYINAYLDGKLSSVKKVTITNCTYTITFKQTGVTDDLAKSDYYYGMTPTAPSNYTIPNPDSDGHYVFNGWSPAIAKVTTDQTYWVQFKKIAHNWVRTSISDSTCAAEGKEYQKCTDCTATRELPVEKKPHTWVKGTVHAPTCTKDGWTDYSCSKCPATKEDDKVPALGHDWKVFNRREATCRDTGLITYECKLCKIQRKEVIPVVDHSYTKETVTKTQTCTTGGHSIYQCIWCDKYDEARGGSAGIDTPALGHDWNYKDSDKNWEVVTPATCESEGLEKRTCQRDKSHVDTRVIAKLGHDYDESITRTVAATCTKDGYTYHPCKHTDCDKYELVSTLPKLNHQDGEKGEWVVTLEAKCETDGLKQYKCALCGEYVKNETLPKLGHSFTNYVKTAEADCVNNAKETATCDRKGCGKTHTREIPDTKLGHEFLPENYRYNNDAKCEIDGTQTAKCTRCDATDTITAPGTALKHVFTDYKESKRATCLTNAEETASCDNNCGKTHTREVPGSALGHTAKNFTHDEGTETCCELGTKTGVCERCSVTFTVAEDRPEYYASHTYETDADGEIVYKFVEDSETCTKDGVERAYCINESTHADGKNWSCGYYLERTAKGTRHPHSFPDPVTESDLYKSNGDGTCVSNGTMSAYCKECHSAKKTVEMPNSKGDHYVANWISDGNATCTKDGTKHGKCVYCGEEFKNEPDVGSALGHWFRDYKTTTAATCTGDRVRTAQCEREFLDEATGKMVRCTATDSVTDKGSALGHDWSAWKFIGEKDADGNELPHNCQHGGTMERHCTRDCCIEIDEETGEKIYKHKDEPKVVGPTAHNYEWKVIEEEGVKTDCTTGYKKHKVCSVCGDVEENSETEVPGGVHNYTINKELSKKATCTEEGLTVITCEICGKEYSRTPIEKTGHLNSYLDQTTVKAATCKEEGYTGDEKCVACDAVTKRGEVIPVTDNHVFKEYSDFEEATCTKNKTEKAVCSVCGKAESVREIPGTALGHDFGEYKESKAATCTKDAEKTAKCSRCGATDTVRVPNSALGHKWGAWKTIEEATCTKVGKAERKCEREGCTVVVYKQLRKLSHTESEWKIDKEATCTEEGKRHTECTGGCGYIFREEVIPKKEHDYEVIASTVTCIDDGYKTFKCKVCGHEKKGEIEKALGHDWSGAWVVTKEPTCTKKGQEKLTCTRCDKSQTRPIDALGHEVVIDPAVPATCTEPGLSEGSHCGRCGEVLKAQETVIKPHRDADEDGKCDECGKEIKHSTDLNCDCICHKKFWLMRAVYAFVRVFWKLFKIGKSCSCGATHY